MKLPKKPEYFAGIKVDGAMERYFKKEEKRKKEESSGEIANQVTAPALSDYIYVPSINCYLAKKRTHLKTNWYDCHKQLHKENLLMPTIPQFLAYINYLKANPNGTSLGDASKQEIESILDNILTVRSPWRAEWLDAKFEKKDRLYINYNHRTINDKLQAQNSEPLESCLMEDCWADVLNGNKQGLPTRELAQNQREIYYWHPKENYVARFGAGSGRADLDCNRDPSDSSASLGVFSVCEANATQRKI